MLLLSQDHDRVIPFDRATDELYATPAIYKGILMGINLNCSCGFLGTFDSVREAMDEMERICSARFPIVVVRGFSRWRV